MIGRQLNLPYLCQGLKRLLMTYNEIKFPYRKKGGNQMIVKGET